MDLFLGIDGGGTGCRAVLADAAGHVLGRGEAGPANIATDFDGALTNILAAADAACAGRDPAGIAAGLGLAGVNAAGTADRLRDALPYGRITIETDAATAVRGALGPQDGIVAALGTGSVFGRQRGGRVDQIGGWGLVLGDEGSGAWIGRAILAHALRAVDGFVAPSPLVAELLDEFGGPSGVVSFSLTARPSDFARLAPRVMGSADPAAQAVAARAEAEIAAAVDLLQGDAVLMPVVLMPVVFLGGLGPIFAARLAGRWPILPARGTALDGALALARGADAPAPATGGA